MPAQPVDVCRDCPLDSVLGAISHFFSDTGVVHVGAGPVLWAVSRLHRASGVYHRNLAGSRSSGKRVIRVLDEGVALAVKNRLPAIYNRPEFVEAGGLVSYSASFTDMTRRAATYVDKILKGAKPADLPVEQPTKFEFIVNLKAAKKIDLTIPPNVLARADKVIK
jgi:hypothetical protein